MNKIHTVKAGSYSSIVGTSVMLHDATGRCIAILSVRNAGDKEAQISIAQQTADLINKGLRNE